MLWAGLNERVCWIQFVYHHVYIVISCQKLFVSCVMYHGAMLDCVLPLVTLLFLFRVSFFLSTHSVYVFICLSFIHIFSVRLVGCVAFRETDSIAIIIVQLGRNFKRNEGNNWMLWLKITQTRVRLLLCCSYNSKDLAEEYGPWLLQVVLKCLGRFGVA